MKRWLVIIGAVLASLLAVLFGRKVLQAVRGTVHRPRDWRPTSDPHTVELRRPGGGWKRVALPFGVTSDKVVAVGRSEHADVAVEVLHARTDRRAADDPGGDLPI